MRSGKSVRKNTPSRNDHRYHYIRDLSITYEGCGEAIHLQTPDLSPHGMFIHTSLYFPETAVIKVRFQLQRTNIEVKARCEVRYCLPRVGIGVEFVDISPEAQQAIEDELGIAEP